MTDSEKISDAMKNFSEKNLTVIFSTYQSIEVIHDLNLNFDLIICDEAHRTTGFDKETNFTKVHDEKFLHAKKFYQKFRSPSLLYYKDFPIPKKFLSNFFLHCSSLCRQLSK